MVLRHEDLGSTDKFSHAILAHLFCPNCARDPPHSPAMRPVCLLVRTKKSTPICRTSFYQRFLYSGTDAATGYVHTITGTAANVHDIVQAHALIRADDHSVYGDSGYLGVEKRAEILEDPHLSSVDYRIAKRPSQNRTTKAYAGVNWDKKIEHEKTSIRCKVEHPYLIVKRLFQAGRTRYRGIKKNLLRYYLLFASANLVMCLRAGRQRAFCMTMG